jgi:hypothetical protein
MVNQRCPRTAIVLSVLIASPSDVSGERDVVTSVVRAWNAAQLFDDRDHAQSSPMGDSFVSGISSRLHHSPASEITMPRSVAGWIRTRCRVVDEARSSEGASGRDENARSGTAATKPAFRDALKSRRCIVPADGSYERPRAGKTKEPYIASRSTTVSCSRSLNSGSDGKTRAAIGSDLARFLPRRRTL